MRKVRRADMARSGTEILNKMKAENVKYNLAQFLRPSARNNQQGELSKEI